jgi:hypothetical protein
MTADDPLFNGDACETCDSRRLSEDDGECICIASPTGECDCVVYSDLRMMEHVAREVAAKFTRICDRTLRREVVEGAAAGFSEACYVQGRGVSFDEAGFCELAGVPREAGA